MSWLFISIIARFIDAWVAILDKIILERTVLKPLPYVFYTGILSIFTAGSIIPFSWVFKSLGVFYFPGFILIFFDFGVGAVLFLAMFLLFYSFSKAEISRITPFIGSAVPIFTFGLSYFILDERLAGWDILAFMLLVLGGFLISFRWSSFILSTVWKCALASALGWAIVFVLLKLLFSQQNFTTVMVWVPMGFFLTSIFILIQPVWRKEIFEAGAALPSKRFYLPFFLFNKILARISSLLIVFSINLASPTMVNALEGVKYIFVFLIAVLFSVFWPRFLKEELTFISVLQKSFAIFFISIGIFILVYQ